MVVGGCFHHLEGKPDLFSGRPSFFRPFKVEDITGPFKCEYGSEMQPYF